MGEVSVRDWTTPGDLGWVVQAHGEVYAAEHGWTQEFEQMVAGIVGDYARGHDPDCERGWMARLDDERVGCILCVRGDAETAVLRTLLVSPAARGHGVGRRLVGDCVDFARASGYRRMRLWTVAGLRASRHLYVDAGFVVTGEEPQHRFGHDVVAQDWELDLAADAERS